MASLVWRCPSCPNVVIPPTGSPVDSQLALVVRPSSEASVSSSTSTGSAVEAWSPATNRAQCQYCRSQCAHYRHGDRVSTLIRVASFINIMLAPRPTIPQLYNNVSRLRKLVHASYPYLQDLKCPLPLRPSSSSVLTSPVTIDSGLPDVECDRIGIELRRAVQLVHRAILLLHHNIRTTLIRRSREPLLSEFSSAWSSKLPQNIIAHPVLLRVSWHLHQYLASNSSVPAKHMLWELPTVALTPSRHTAHQVFSQACTSTHDRRCPRNQGKRVRDCTKSQKRWVENAVRKQELMER
eukprot:4585988-Amphidinium_carterae.1